MAADGSLRVLLSSNVREIRKDAVAIETNGENLILPNNAVIICAGGILPTGFLKEIGIDIETKFGTA
jgi:thioredoxin reductase